MTTRRTTTAFLFLAIAAGIAQGQTETARKLAAKKIRPQLSEKGIEVGRVEAALPKGVREHLDVVYARYDSRELHLDLYTPVNRRKPSPAIVVVHGGGWLKGNKTSFRSFAQAFAARGYVAATIEYRLGGEARFPAGIHDCNAAVRWLRANAAEFGIDPNRIAAVGGSAGGHLVGLMATASHLKELQGNGGNNKYSSALQAAVVMAGPMELATGSVADRSRKEPKKSNANQWFGKTIDEAPELYKLASPFTHVSKRSPPVLFLCGEHDQPSRNANTRYKLQQLGIHSAIRVYKYGRHGCWNQNPWFGSMVDDMDAFISSSLKHATQAAPLSITKAQWGEIHGFDDRLELHVTAVPDNRMITIPRYDARIGRVYLKNETKSKMLKLRPGTDSWSITLPPAGTEQNNIVVVVEMKDRPVPHRVPRVVSESIKGDVILPAHAAVTVGKMLRFEPQPKKNTVGYWVNEKDYCEWTFFVDRPGQFQVHILQGCGKGQGGSQVGVSIGKQQLVFSVEDTGHFQNFKDRNIGTVKLAQAGVYILQVRPIKKAANAIMDVRQVKLVRQSATVD